MKHVSILLLENVNLAGLENARQGLIEANRFLTERGFDPYFKVQIVGLKPQIKINGGLYLIRADTIISEVSKTDIVIIPPVQPDLNRAIQSNQKFFSWIRMQRKMGADVVSLCLGAFILAGSGIIDNKDCVTHWKFGEVFQSLFPKVNLLSDKILTANDGIYTGGGAFSSVNLILYLIEKSIGRECSVYCSKIFQVDLGRNSQSPYIIFKGQRKHADHLVHEAQLFIESQYTEKITVDVLCDKLGLSRRTFERRFKKATANSPLEYLQRVRVEAAKTRLEEAGMTIGEIAYVVGYSDMKAFREIFKRFTGISPIEYRAKFCRSVQAVEEISARI
ncbi:MAG: helix-turn-helix domain-containing protein [Cyclobacteriaceae bacterium]|nr:helix-turn-helix domain-containing protein [Cyclobacteriaceae bacterium]